MADQQNGHIQSQGNHSLLTEFGKYIGTQSGGALINFVVYALVLESSVFAANYPAIALAPASLAAMVFNFLILRHWVFDPQGR